MSKILSKYVTHSHILTTFAARITTEVTSTSNFTCAGMLHLRMVLRFTEDNKF